MLYSQYILCLFHILRHCKNSLFCLKNIHCASFLSAAEEIPLNILYTKELQKGIKRRPFLHQTQAGRASNTGRLILFLIPPHHAPVYIIGFFPHTLGKILFPCCFLFVSLQCEINILTIRNNKTYHYEEVYINTHSTAHHGSIGKGNEF